MVFVLTRESGEYDSFRVAVIGYATSEAEARRLATDADVKVWALSAPGLGEAVEVQTVAQAEAEVAEVRRRLSVLTKFHPLEPPDPAHLADLDQALQRLRVLAPEAPTAQEQENQ